MAFNNINVNEKLVPQNYLKLAQDAHRFKEITTKELIEKRKLPNVGWSDDQIEEFVRQLASLDSNNFGHKTAGLGEREARIACELVARRHYNFGHGIGRSGDLLEPQPKAAGSTMLSNLTNALLLDLVRQMGVHSCQYCFLVPQATGMTLMLCLLTFKKQRPKAKYVLWSRIDQKSCFKCITSAGLIPVIIDPISCGGGKDLSTDIAAYERSISAFDVNEIVCIFSTTSCFAPRNSDNIVALAGLAAKYNLPHLVNNAYGLQSSFLMHQLQQAHSLGRIDLFVQSTDKNLMVPVGAAIVAGFNEVLVRNVAKTYAGRASSSHTLDVLMTLLSLGKGGYLKYVNERKQHFNYLNQKLIEFAEEHNVSVVNSKRNPISLALTLSNLHSASNKSLTQFGSMLYTRGISGVRVIVAGDNKEIDGHTLSNWGTHQSESDSKSPTPYLTVAASLGITVLEIDAFFKKLRHCWQTFSSK